MSKMRKFFLTGLIFSYSILIATLPSFAERSGEEGLEYLLFEEIPEITIASKTAQSLNKATSVVSVITEKEITRSGARTIYELLKRVPGFFPTAQASWTQITSRGITDDGGDHVLLLIDGHAQNSIIGQGSQQQVMIPTLEKVKQIEIIRGPGSVLWGSSAVWGIINIITKEGGEGKITKTTVSYGDGDGMLSVNYLTTFGNSEETNGMISISYWESDGYNRPGRTENGGAAWDKATAQTVKANVEFPWGEIGDWPPLDQHKEGYEIYGKVKIGENKILARIVETNVAYPWDTWLNAPGSDLMMRKAYLDYSNTVAFTDSFKIETTIFGDYLLQNRFPADDTLFAYDPAWGKTMLQDQTNEEMAFGIEFLGRFQINENNNLKAGIKGVRTKIGPNRDARFDVYQNYPYYIEPGTTNELPYLGVESGYDNNWALYAEWLGSFGALDMFAGGRYDKNDFREDEGIFLPRGGIIFNFTDDTSLKLVYNSGYLRPAAVYSKTVGKIVDTNRGPTQDILRVTDSEEIQSLEAQFYIRNEKNYFSANVFVMEIDNYISFDANNTPQGYKNLGNVTTKGLELEGKIHANDQIAFYGNYSYALGELDESLHQGALTNNDNETLNYPTHILNIGVDWLITDRTSLNVNLNAWRDMRVVLPIGEANTYGEFSELDGEEYLDINFVSNMVFNSPFDLSIFCTNVFDNTEPVGLVVNNGYYYPRGRNIGGKLTIYW